MTKKKTPAPKKTAKKAAAPKPETAKAPAVESKPEAPATATPTPTRGQKACPSCGKIQGAASRACECGHAFTPKTKAPKAKRGRRASGGTMVPVGVATDLEHIKAAATFIKAVGGLPQAEASLAVAKSVGKALGL